MNQESTVTPRALVLIALLFHLNGCLFERRKPSADLAIQATNQDQKIALAPPALHHFNLKAPQNLHQGGKHLVLALTAEKITTPLSGLAANEPVSGTLIICDTNETYCRPVSVNIQPEQLSKPD